MARTEWNAKRREARRAGRRCERCNELIENLHGLRRRCDGCQQQLDNERQRQKRQDNPGMFHNYDRKRQAARTQAARDRSDPRAEVPLCDRCDRYGVTMRAGQG